MASARDFLDDIDDMTLPPAEPLEDKAITQLLAPLEQQVVELYLQKLPVDTIALRLALPKSTVMTLLAKPEIQEQLRHLSESMNVIETMRLKGLCERMIEEKISLAEETDQALSKKDLLEVMKVYNEILSAERKAKEPKQEQNIFIDILKQVT
jgi:hypothetical protein